MTIGIAPSASPHNSHGLAKPNANRPLADRFRRTKPITSGSPHALHPPGQKRAERDVERMIRSHERIIHPQVSAPCPNFAQEILELALVRPAERAGLGSLLDKLFQATKAGRLVERKILLGRIDNLHYAHIVAAMGKVFEARHQARRVIE